MSMPPTQPPTAPDPWEHGAPGAPDPWPLDLAPTTVSPHPAPPQPPTEPSAQAAPPSGTRRGLAIGLVAGLLLGAAAVGVTWWATSPKPTPKAAPKTGTFDISVDAMPETVLGAERVDLRVAKNGQNPAAAKPYVDAATSSIKSFEKAYGGPGIQMSYGATDAMRVTLTIANAVVPAPQELTDERIQLAKSINASLDPAIAAYDEDNVVCVAAPKEVTKAESTVDPKALREQVLAATDGSVRCIRSDASAKMSIMITARSWGDPATMKELAAKTAKEINTLWSQLA